MLHFNVTNNPSAQWSAQQIMEAFPLNSAPLCLIRDRDSIYGEIFNRRVESMGIKAVISARRSPWKNPYVERLIGSVRRECLDHLIPINERHLMGVLRSYFDYHHGSRTHMSLDGNAPIPRTVEPPELGNHVISLPMVGGLHHRYTCRAAKLSKSSGLASGNRALKIRAKPAKSTIPDHCAVTALRYRTKTIHEQ